MKRLYFLPLLCLWLSYGYSQTIDSNTSNIKPHIVKNTVYVELLGNAGLYSLNYDRILVITNKLKITSRVGFSFYSNGKQSALNSFLYPVGVSILYGKKHHVETGVGYTKVFEAYKRDIKMQYYNQNVFIARIGYRYQKEKSCFYRSAGVLFSTKKRVVPTVWLAIALGYSF